MESVIEISAVKFVLLAVTLLAMALPAHSQTQERGLLERMDNPDMTLANPMQSRKFVATDGMKIRPYSAAKDAFAVTREASLGSYAFTRTFFGVRNPWLGPKAFDAKKASLYSRTTIPNLTNKMPVRKAEVVTFDPQKDTANFGNPVVATREFRGDGAAPGAVSRMSEKITKDMTIQEVRELLNKPR